MWAREGTRVNSRNSCFSRVLYSLSSCTKIVWQTLHLALSLALVLFFLVKLKLHECASVSPCIRASVSHFFFSLSVAVTFYFFSRLTSVPARKLVAVCKKLEENEQDSLSSISLFQCVPLPLSFAGFSFQLKEPWPQGFFHNRPNTRAAKNVWQVSVSFFYFAFLKKLFECLFFL